MTTVTIGMDLGDKKHQICVLDATGGKVAEEMVDNTAAALSKYFRKHAGAVVAMETGTHSPWISRLLTTLGCRVLVGNARKLRAIWQNANKSDVRDAEMLARIARFDPELLYPVHHRSEQAHADLERIKARDALVRSRRYGLRIAERGGKNAKKRAVVAVARKLAVLLHHLWKTGVDYEPLRTAGSPVG